MTLCPPQPAQPGTPYYMFFDFYDYENGAWAEPTSLSLAITYGNVTSGLGAASTAGPFSYTGASVEGSDTIWRLGEGQYQPRWDVPGVGIQPGVYIANWTAGYGGDQFLAEENIPVQGAGPITPPPAGDTGYWTGSLTYQPSWAGTPFTIPLGQVDANGTSWILKGVTGWDSPPVVGVGGAGWGGRGGGGAVGGGGAGGGRARPAPAPPPPPPPAPPPPPQDY